MVAASAKAKSYLGVPATVVLHGIDADAFAPATDRRALRSKLGLDEDALIVGCFGRIRSQKGTDLFVDAMIDLLPRHPAAQGIVMGGVTRDQQGFVDDLKAKIKAAGLSDRLRILPEDTGFTIAPWFKASDIYVAPQRWEGFGLTPLEAMSCGVPVVATRVGAFEDLVVPEKTGFLVPPEDLGALVDATDKLMSNATMRQSMAKAARHKVVEQHQIAHEADAMIDLLPRHPAAQGIVMGGVTRDQQGFVDDLKAKIKAAGLSDRLRILPEDTGFTIAPWFKASDIYVAPQRWEGFGLTPLEAMSCGVPVVATRVGAFEDLVVPEKTGFLVPPEDLGALVDATDKLMSNATMRQSMANAARHKVVEQHQIAHEADALIAIYQRLLTEG
ncbi:MAG: glycosyltransferase family 4 protein [Pseudomonadota bacterium]